MSNEQLLMIVGVPIIWNTLLYMAFAAAMNRRFDDFKAQTNQRFEDFRTDINRRFDDFASFIDRRFTLAESNWRSELHRVEEILDARLKHLEGQ